MRASLRTAYVVLPAWYGTRRHPSIPVVISPHGRGVSGSYNLRFWGDVAGAGAVCRHLARRHGRRLAVLLVGLRGPDRRPRADAGASRRRRSRGCGSTRARVRIGDSMGGQEVLLLAARSGIRLAGVAAFDPVTSMAARYRVWPMTPGEAHLPALARVEFGGTPAQVPECVRSAKSDLARARDRAQRHPDPAVVEPPRLGRHRPGAQTAALLRPPRRARAEARVQEVVGYWEHAREFHPGRSCRRRSPASA